MGIVASLLGVVSFVMGIIVLLRLFKKEGTLKGILGLLCMLYTFIWGWQHYKEEDIKNIMLIWSGVIVVTIIINAIARSAGDTGSLLPLFA